MSTTRDLQARLRELLSQLNAKPVMTWLHGEKESPGDISDTVSLMLEVQAALMGEIDLFIGSVESGAFRGDAASEGELRDLADTEAGDSSLVGGPGQ